MADTIRKIEYFYMEVPHKVGEGAKVLRALKDAGVNLIAFAGYPSGRRAQLDFFPDDAAALRRAARANGWKLTGPRRGFWVQGNDRVGAIADLLGKLADANVNVIAIDAVCVGGGYGALCWVEPADFRKAAKTLDAA